MSEFLKPLFELGERVLVHIEDPAFACYSGQVGLVLDTRWMNSKEAGERGVAGWQYQVSIAMPAMFPWGGLDIMLLWCAESMLRKNHETGMPFDVLMEELQHAPPYLAGEPFDKLISSIKACLPFPKLEMDGSGDPVLPSELCGCGRPARYIMGRADAPILSCNRIRRCPPIQIDQKNNQHGQEDR